MVPPAKLSLQGDRLLEKSMADWSVHMKIKPAVPMMHVGTRSIISTTHHCPGKTPQVPFGSGCAVKEKAMRSDQAQGLRHHRCLPPMSPSSAWLLQAPSNPVLQLCPHHAPSTPNTRHNCFSSLQKLPMFLNTILSPATLATFHSAPGRANGLGNSRVSPNGPSYALA